MVEQIEHPERFLPPEQRTYGPINTKGLSPALLTDNGILGLAYNLVTGSDKTQTAVWERRLAKKVDYWSRRKQPTRNVKMLLENIAPIIDADPSVLDFLKKEELLTFAMTVRELQRKRSTSLGYYQRRYHLPETPEPAFIHPVPPGTRLMRREDYDLTHRDLLAHIPFRTRLWQGIQELRRVVPAVLAIPSALVVAAVLIGDVQPEPPIPLLRDQTRVQPTSDLTKTAPVQVTEVHKIVQTTITNLPPESEKPPKPEQAEILFRLLDEETGKPLKGTVEFDGQTAQTNGAGLIHMTGNTLRSFGRPPASEVLKITLRNGPVFYVEKEIRAGLNSTLLKPEEGIIRIALKG